MKLCRTLSALFAILFMVGCADQSPIVSSSPYFGGNVSEDRGGLSGVSILYIKCDCCPQANWSLGYRECEKEVKKKLADAITSSKYNAIKIDTIYRPGGQYIMGAVVYYTSTAPMKKS